MTLDELPDDFTPQAFMRLDKASLDAIPFTRKKWLCAFRGCTNGTKIRDYGLDGGWFMLDRNSKACAKNPHDYWRGVNNSMLCGKHWKLYERIRYRFDPEHVHRRMVDPNKDCFQEIPGAGKLGGVEQIENKK